MMNSERRTRIVAGVAMALVLLGLAAFAGRRLGWIGSSGVSGPQKKARPPDAPRLDVRERSRHLAERPPFTPDDLPPGAQAVPDSAAIMSLARSTIAEYRHRARYPNWSQPLASGEDPLLRDQPATALPSAGAAAGAELTGNYRDKEEGGDLTIDSELNVLNEGQFLIEATLYRNEGGEPIAWAQQTSTLPPGRHWLTLRFQGLIIRERGLDGPYLLRAVSLTRMPNTKNALVQNAFVTRSYDHADFSDKPFNDPELLDAADRIERALEGLVAAEKADATGRPK